MSDQERERVEVETSGETVGEARWAALHELERRFPSLQRDDVQFVVLTEGERGLLGVGYKPARVLASVQVDAAATVAAPVSAPISRSPAPADESPPAARVRDLLERVLEALAIDGRLDLVEQDGVVTATVTGPELGLLIGKHGQTIDAIQYLANAIMHRREEHPVEVVVDAEGYRKRRERTLHEVAMRATAEAASSGSDVALEPMTSVERKIVHTKVQSMGGFATASEGAEPNRYVVVRLDPDA
jgi:spoIIIJ-associated protein